ncbi:MAG: hypothetical protein ACLR67_00240 [Eggerthella lenta]
MLSDGVAASDGADARALPGCARRPDRRRPAGEAPVFIAERDAEAFFRALPVLEETPVELPETWEALRSVAAHCLHFDDGEEGRRAHPPGGNV